MIFLDRAGFFSLVCLVIQCVMSWVFVGFFAGLAPRRAAYLRCWLLAFLGLSIALTAVSVRYLFAHVDLPHTSLLREGAPLTRVFYGVYLTGKVVFLWFLVAGLVALGQRPWRLAGGFWTAATMSVAFLVGMAARRVELLLLLQAPLAALAYFYGARLVGAPPGDRLEGGRRVVGAVLRLWGCIWVGYGICVVMVLVGAPGGLLWHLPLQLNAIIDVTLQVVLAIALIVVALQEGQRAVVDALRERDRLREQLQRDEKLRALSTLVSGVAHEINNPLTTILGFVDDLAEDETTVRRKAAQVIKEQAERCRGIVQRLSILGRRAPAARIPIEVESLVQRVAAGFRPQFAQAGVSLRLDLHPMSRQLVGEPTALEQVLANLVANALQASPRGGEVVLRASAVADALQFDVDDGGPGVPAADRVRVFEPFWTTKQVGQGTGLGLAVVRALVQACGGEVVVGDSPAGGARFSVRVPWLAADLAPAVAPAAGEPRSPGVAATRASGPLRLLVVDDEQIVRSTIVRRAQLDGWSTREAASAEAALAILFDEGAGFDAIVCDLRMPGMSGIGFHDRLADRAPDLLRRVLFVTGDLASADALAFAARCRSSILTKPFDFAELFARLRSATAQDVR